MSLSSSSAEARTPDPQLMLEGYHQSVQTLNILRAFSTGGFADISRLHEIDDPMTDEVKSSIADRRMSVQDVLGGPPQLANAVEVRGDRTLRTMGVTTLALVTALSAGTMVSIYGSSARVTQLEAQLATRLAAHQALRPRLLDAFHWTRWRGRRYYLWRCCL